MVGFLVLAGAVSMFTPAAGQVSAVDDATAIRAVWDEATAALVAKAWERYSRVWTHAEDVQVIHPSERSWITGWAAIEARYRAVISSNVELKAETRRFDVRVSPSRDVAWATVEASVTAGGVTHTSWQVVVFQKAAGRWLMVLGFDAPLAAAAR